jgi:Variant SH3 domain
MSGRILLALQRRSPQQRHLAMARWTMCLPPPWQLEAAEAKGHWFNTTMRPRVSRTRIFPCCEVLTTLLTSYLPAEDNEIELKEGEYVTNIDMVDEDWWMGENAQGQTGLFPSNYVELVGDDEDAPATPHPAAAQPAAGPSNNDTKAGPTATAIYDYEAAGKQR